MARLNTNRPGSTTPGRALSTSSRINTPVAAQVARASGSPSESSDKENASARRVDKGKARMPPPGKLPTPVSDTRVDSRAAKRRRTDDVSPSLNREPDDEEEDEENVEEDEGEEDEEAHQATQKRKNVEFYDPGQDQSERRDVKRKSRALEREFNENRNDYDNDGLQRTIARANDIFEGVKQTSDATLDSRLMVSLSDLTAKRSGQLVLGDSATGIDVDEFVSKCITFMRQGQNTNNSGSSTQRRRQTRGEDDSDNEQETFLDWERLGRIACFPNNLRPAVPSFLLGPLSVQKRVRAPTQRRARQARDTAGQESRPENLTHEDMSTNERNSVRHECAKIKTLLISHCQRAQTAVEQALDDDADASTVTSALRSHRLTDTGGPSLFDFVINPSSFSQTVENLFYVSFLIKEGEVGIGTDSEGLPTLNPNSESIRQAREKRQARHQAVFGLDYDIWRRLVEAFEIETSLIPTREAEEGTQRVGQRGWYG